MCHLDIVAKCANYARPQPSLRINHNKQELHVERRVHRIFTWKTQGEEKPQEFTNSNYHYVQNIQWVSNTEATTSCSQSSPQAAVTTDRGNDLFVSLSLCTQLHIPSRGTEIPTDMKLLMLTK